MTTDTDAKLIQEALDAGCPCEWPDAKFFRPLMGDDIEGDFIAACSPDRVARLLAERAQLLETIAHHQETTRKIAQALVPSGLVKDRGYLHETVAQLVAERTSLLSRVEELEKDAARYRWLRDSSESSVHWDHNAEAESHVRFRLPILEFDPDFTDPMRWAHNVDAAMDEQMNPPWGRDGLAAPTPAT